MIRHSCSFASLALLASALVACAEPVDETRVDEPVAPRIEQAPVVEESPAAPEPIGATAEMEADENVPSIAELQAALGQCADTRDVLEAQCSASDDGESFTCTYSLDGDTAETERETVIAASGDSYTLVEIPEDCSVG